MGGVVRLVVVALALAAPALAAPVLADVTGRPTVIDGETLEVGGERFRLYGIDAPDLRQKCEIRGRRYDCGKVSRSALMDLVAGVEVRCVPRESTPRESRVATCFAGGYDLSEGMVHTGWAMAMPRRGTKYARIERSSKKARRGLWQGNFEMPWAWKP